MLTSTIGTWAAFIEAMLQELPGRRVVTRDGGTMHKGDPIRQLEAHFADRLRLELLTPFAPMLNPVEPLWIHSTQYRSRHRLRSMRQHARKPGLGPAATGRSLPVPAR
jgi:transposase